MIEDDEAGPAGLARKDGTCAIMDCGAELALRALDRYKDAYDDNGEEE